MLPRTLTAESFLVAHSPAMRTVVDALHRHAHTGAPVMICGEHGTGRELVARVLHAVGPRRTGRFVTVRPTFETGETGAAPLAGDDGARARQVLDAARGGTLLVKDVCDASPGSQDTLVGAVGAVTGGGAPTPGAPAPTAPLDVRVVGTGDHDLGEADAARLLTPGLYQAIAGQRIDVPPLRDRTADLPELTERWVAHYAAAAGRGKLMVAARAHDRLARYPWPGNVGELKNITRRLVGRVTAERIEAGDVDRLLPVVAERVPLDELAFEDLVKAKLSGFLDRMDGYPLADLYEQVLERVERPLLDLVLARTGGNQVRAAELLGINRNTLRSKLTRLGMARTRRRPGAALDQ